MMLAMMIRSSLGHTGRALRASRLDMLAFVVLQAAVMFRVLAGISVAYTPYIVASGLAWISAFGLFALRFLPILLGPRIDTQSS